MIPGRLPGNTTLAAILSAIVLAGCTSTAGDLSTPSLVALSANTPSTGTPTYFAPVPPTSLPPARPLTEAGCCVDPWWSSDSKRVLFLDRPDESAPAMVYAVDIASGSIALSNAPLGLYDDRGRLVALPGAGGWQLAATDGTAGWGLPSGVRGLRLSHDRAWVAWTEGSSLPVNVDQRQRSLWMAAIDGQSPKSIVQLTGGDLIGWADKDQGLLVSGTPAGQTAQGVWRIGTDGSASLLIEVERVRGTLLSPDGRWLAFIIAFSGDPNRDGLWVADTQTGAATRLEVFGAYRWRSGEELLLLPYNPGEGDLELMQYDASRGQLEPLLPQGSLPGAVANNEWRPSPDGRWLVYLHATDRNLWLVQLP